MKVQKECVKLRKFFIQPCLVEGLADLNGVGDLVDNSWSNRTVEHLRRLEMVVVEEGWKTSAEYSIIAW